MDQVKLCTSIFYFIDTRLILQELKDIKIEAVETKNRLRRIEVILESILKKDDLSKSSFIIDNQLNVPFKDIAEFTKFNEKLSADQQFRLHFVSL